MITHSTLAVSYPCSSIPRPFCDSFKQEAIKQLKVGNSLKNVTRFMGVSKTTIKRWLRESSETDLLISKPYSKSQQSMAAVKPKIMVQIDCQHAKSSSLKIPASVSKNFKDYPVYINKYYAEIVKTKRMRFDDDFRQRALIKLNNGLSAKKVARLVGVSVNTINKWRKDYTIHQYNIDESVFTTENTINSKPNSSDLVNKRLMRKHYNEQFKLEAIELIESGKSVRRVAKQLNVSELTLHRWRNQANPDKQRKFYSTTIKDTSLEQEAQQLREQLSRIEHERDLLRKSLSIVVELT